MIFFCVVSLYEHNLTSKSKVYSYVATVSNMSY